MISIERYGFVVSRGKPGHRFLSGTPPDNRFPLRVEVRYKLLNCNVVAPGVGKTINIGSGGVLFTTERRLPISRTIELALNWPAMLNGTPLKFVATGPIVRAEEDRAARCESSVTSSAPAPHG
jgi:hypothetical protein